MGTAKGGTCQDTKTKGGVGILVGKYAWQHGRRVSGCVKAKGRDSEEGVALVTRCFRTLHVVPHVLSLCSFFSLSPSARVQQQHESQDPRCIPKLNTHLAHPSITCVFPPSDRMCHHYEPRLWDTLTMLQELPQQAHNCRMTLPTMSSTNSSFSNTSDHPQDTSCHLEL